MQNKKYAVKTTLQICPFARRSEGYQEAAALINEN